MTDTITLTGIVATAPRHVTTSSGLAITNFRLASSQRKFDRTKNEWVDGDTNWYTVSAFRQLAANTRASVHLGAHVVVTGRLKIRQWQSGDKSGTTVEVDADVVGLDLTWGFTTFTKGTAVVTPDSSSTGSTPGSPPESQAGASDRPDHEPTRPAAADPEPLAGADPGGVLVGAGVGRGAAAVSPPASWAVAPLGGGGSTPF